MAEVAIVGGGLCGLALAISLTKLSIPWHLYEVRSSFVELGAGINIGPNMLSAFKAIDPLLAEAVFEMSSHNPDPHAWMQVRYGAATGSHLDHELVTTLMAPPTGNMAVQRNDLLQLLASYVPHNTSFNKKLTSIIQDSSGVTLSFADGTSAKASIVIGCDGIHSAVRRAVLEGPASEPHFLGEGAYRAMIPTVDLKPLLDDLTSQVLVGSNGYVILYPVAGGEKFNVGLWLRKPQEMDGAWIKPHQRAEMLHDLSAWGPTVQKILDLIPDPSYWGVHCYTVQPEHTFVGRVCLIGDAAHGMPPHQGAGAGQAMEDAFILAEVLSVSGKSQPEVEAAFGAYEAVRKPRYQRVLESSIEAMQFWSSMDRMAEDSAGYSKAAVERFEWIWRHDIRADAELVRSEYWSRVGSGAGSAC